MSIQERGRCWRCGERKPECIGVGQGCYVCATEAVEEFVAQKRAAKPAAEKQERAASQRKRPAIEPDAFVAQPDMFETEERQ